MPLFGGVLAGDDGSRLSVAILDDIEQAFAFGIGNGEINKSSNHAVR
jgi:hypothetical protein